jgi:hypothetical protein
MIESARSAMLRWVAGGITRSSVPITVQLGMVFQAVVRVGAVFAPSVIGRLARDDQPPVRLGEVLREGIVDGRWFEERLGVPFRSSGVADDIENGIGSGTSNAEPEPPRIWKVVSPTSGMNAST